MKHSLAILAALTTAISVPAAAEDASLVDDAVVNWGLALAGNVLPDGKLHKLRYPMCLLVAAEDQALAKTVAERVVENAEQAGVAVKRGRCAPNTLIAFTDDDCVLEPGWLQAVERGFLRADNVGMVGGWVCHEHARERSAIDTYYATFHHNTT